MLLCIDVGNTNVTFGVYKEKELIYSFRLRTKEIRKNQFNKKIKDDLKSNNISIDDIEDIIVCSVAPSIDEYIKNLCTKFNKNVHFIDYKFDLGINNMLVNKSEVGSDIYVGLYAAYEKYNKACLVIDMGTATTLALIDNDKNFYGGIIYPGVVTSFNYLFRDAEKLGKIKIDQPKSVIGNSTQESIRSGMVYGSSSMINGLVELVRKEYSDIDFNVIITGGIAHHILPYLNECIYDENLLIDGLLNIYYKFIKRS